MLYRILNYKLTKIILGPSQKNVRDFQSIKIVRNIIRKRVRLRRILVKRQKIREWNFEMEKWSPL